MRRILIAAGFATMVLALPAAAQQEASAPPTASDFAKNMRGAIGQTFEGGIQIKDITAEANTLVMTVSGPDGWRGSLTPDRISAALVSGFCEPAPQFFSTGVTMRVDSLDRGALVRGPLISSCPPKPAP